MALTNDEQQDCMRWCLHHCDERIAEIDAVLRTVPPNSEQERALQRERADLRGAKRIYEAKLHALLNPPKPDPVRKAKIERWLNSQKADIIRSVARREAERDFRDAAIWRAEVFRLPDRVAQELGL
jgi:hypothetical protein